MRLSNVWLGLVMCAALQARVRVVEGPAAEGFPLVQDGRAAAIITDAEDFEVVQVAALALVRDILAVTSVTPALHQDIEAQSPAVIIGTVGHNRWIDQLVEAGTLDVTALAGQWETSLTTVVSSPLEGTEQVLVIAGSDGRGTAFGVFELSRQMGVSPWRWWADVKPHHKEALSVEAEAVQLGPPSVKYRGIFLSDEDWGLQPWAATHLDRDIQDIGPGTYAQVFELLLRLKANYLWPAMRPCTKAFSEYPENPVTAERYAIVVGSSHYNESTSRYDRLNLPEPGIMVWTDDNYGYLRELPTPEMQKRYGASGVYYHLSYQGMPHDYLWLCSTGPAQISTEMSKAYAYGATHLWVFNVGDIKPAEMEMEFSLDLAWDVEAWSPDRAHTYAKAWAIRTFGSPVAEHIARIKHQYYTLAASARPEHVLYVTFEPAHADARMAAYESITREVQFLYAQVPGALKDAYFQLVLYPVKGACLMNLKHLYARKSLRLAEQGDPNALEYATRATQSHELIQSLTTQYNQGIASGKWAGMMSSRPRDRSAFAMPQVATKAMVAGQPVFTHHIPVTVISAADFSVRAQAQDSRVEVIEQLGIDGRAVTRSPVTGKSFDQDHCTDAPYVEYYTTALEPGMRMISVQCVPAHRIHEGRHLSYGIQVNGGPVQFKDVHAHSETRAWSRNALRGFSEGRTLHSLEGSDTVIRVYLLDPGLALSRLVIE